MNQKFLTAMCLGIAVAAALPLPGQVTSQLRSALNQPSSNANGPTLPGGGIVLGNKFWLCDGFESFLPLAPVDPANTDPINAGLLSPNVTFDLVAVVPSCGQVALGGAGGVFLTDYVRPHARGFYSGGIKRIVYHGDSNITHDTIATTAGLGANQPTSLAFGPDGNLYVGFLKNGAIKRIVNPGIGTTQKVQSVGTVTDARAALSLAFVGADLYIADTSGLHVITNAISATCLGSCKPVAVQDGFVGIAHVGLTSDGRRYLYMSVNNQVWRYNVRTGGTTLISTAGGDSAGPVMNYSFDAGRTNLLQIDRLGNLWIGDDPTDGTQKLLGRVFYISAADLHSIL
jgi:hypothetical protein